MIDPTPCTSLAPQSDFLHLQAKDLITAVIGLAALLSSVTGVWVAYLRRYKLECDLSDSLRIGRGPGPQHFLMFRIDVYAMNSGARPGVIKRMAIKINDIESPAKWVHLHWTENTKSENIAGKGEARKVWTDFAGFASPVLVPKYDARVVEPAFWADVPFELLSGHSYDFRLVLWLAGEKEPIQSPSRRIAMDLNMSKFLNTLATVDESGIRARHLNLTANDGQNYTAPPSTFGIAQGERIPLQDSPKVSQTP